MDFCKGDVIFNLSLDDCVKIADSGQYECIPLIYELYSDTFTPVNVLKRLKRKSERCFLLESAEHDRHFGRYSILGFDPKFELLLNNGELSLNGLRKDSKADSSVKHISNPSDDIKRLLDSYRSYPSDSVPFTGGLVGCFSYDFLRYSEPVLRNVDLQNGDFFDCDLLFFDKVVVFDHYRQKLNIIINISTSQVEKGYLAAAKTARKMAKIISKGREYRFEPLSLNSELVPQFSQQRFTDMVNKAKDYIHNGDIFQVVLSNPMRAQATGSLFDAYRILRSTNPSPYMFYFTSPYTEIAGASPETLVSMRGGVMRTYPLGGTRKRGADDAEDERIEKDLLSDAKECAEHNMLVDLGRNDIGRVAKIGTVEVTKYMKVEKYSHVMHIASEVAGQIQDGKGAMDALQSILPAGTLSGAPKIRACQIIDELEGVKRGIYGGAIGYIDLQGNLDTAIAIRLAYKKSGVLTVQSGAGIVADSVPEKEAQECQNKAKAVVDALTLSQGGLL